MIVEGTVVAGSGIASQIMDLDSLHVELGYRPVLGTLNLEVAKSVRGALEEMRGDRTYLPCTVMGHACHVHFPRGGRIEIIGPVRFRDSVTDGDVVRCSVGDYQDVWRDGTLVRRGRRDCAERYGLILPYLQGKVEPGFRLLDVGGWEGYFTRRLVEDMRADAVMWEPRSAPDVKGFTHVEASMNSGNVDNVGRPDVTLLLSVLHHMPDWENIFRALRERSRIVIVELAHEDEAALVRGVPDAERLTGETYRGITGGTLLGMVAGPNGVDRPVLAFDRVA